MSDFVKAEQIIGSRYRLVERDIDQLPYSGVSVWRATDTMLKNSVRILVLDPRNKNFAETLDAARRASLFEDAHAVKILGVGSNPTHGWIVTEIPLGVPLSYRLHGEAFEPEQAKALVGETARVITAAAAQGIRHLTVKPSDIRIDAQGQVFIDGLGIHAALAGIRTDTDMPHELDRKEASGLTHLYAQLLSGEADGDAGVAIQNVSQDENIDSSLRYFFEKSLRGAGALSASDLIRNLGSWQELSVAALPAIPGTHTGDIAPEDMDEELGIPHEPALSTAPAWPTAQAPIKEASDEEDASEDTSEEIAPKDDTSEQDISEDDTREEVSPEGDDSVDGDSKDGVSEENAPEESAKVESVSEEDLAEDDSPEQDETSSEETSGENSEKTDVSSEESSEETAEESSEETPEEPSEKKNFLKTIAAKTSQSGKELSAKTASGIASVASSKAVRGAISSLERQMDKVSDVPEGGGSRRYNTSWLFTVISIALVVVSGIWAFSVFFSTPKIATVEQGPTGPAIIGNDDNPDGNTEEAAVNPLIESVTLLNPQAGNVPTSEGVQQDNPDTLANLIDGDTSTVWQSWWYPTSHFTVGKDWLGVQIKLKEPTAIENVYLQVNGNGGKVQWRMGDDAHPDKAQLLDESFMSTATYLVPDQPVTTDVITVWIHELPKDKVQKNRVVIAEVDINRQLSDTVRQSAQSD